MATPLTFLAAHTAVLGMDCQSSVVSFYAKPKEAFLERCVSVLGAARKAGMAVIHVRFGFRPGLPEASARNKLIGAIKASVPRQRMFEGEAGAIHPALGPAADEPVVTKHRISAFPGSDLQMILRSRDIDTLVLFGIATSGVVLSTMLEACDADYRIVVVTDCCADNDADLHRVLVERLFPMRCEVTTAAEFVKAAGA